MKQAASNNLRVNTTIGQLAQASATSTGISLLTTGIIWAAPASALTITQSFGINVNGGSQQNIAYQQFDPNLGTLTGISFSYSGVTTGSFTLTAGDVNSYTLTAANSQIGLSWVTGSGTKPSNSSPQTDIFNSLSSSTGSFIVDAEGTATFSLSSPATISGGPLNYLANAAYFTGPGSVTLTLRQLLNYSGINSSTTGLSSLNYGGPNAAATLAYDYTPVPVPVALPVLGAVAGYSFLRRQRRRVNALK